MNCEYCGKDFYHKSNLVRHQTTSKKCIKIQQDNNSNVVIKLFICEHCDKQLSSKQSLIRHLNFCMNKKDNEINELKNNFQNEITEIKLRLESINNANNINNTNNIMNSNNTNTINNITNININNIDFMSYMTSEKIREVFDKCYNIQTLSGSKESLAHFTIDNFLSGSDKPIYLCSDKERNKFCFYDKNNKKIDDTNAQILINLITTYGLKSIKKLYKRYTKRIKEKSDDIDIAYNNIMNLKTDGKDYINELSTLLPKTIEERTIRDSIVIQDDEDETSSDEEDLDEEESEIVREKQTGHLANQRLSEGKRGLTCLESPD